MAAIFKQYQQLFEQTQFRPVILALYSRSQVDQTLTYKA